MDRRSLLKSLAAALIAPSALPLAAEVPVWPVASGVLTERMLSGTVLQNFERVVVMVNWDALDSITFGDPILGRIQP